MATTLREETPSTQDQREWPVFFVPPVGFIQYVNPYALLGIHEDTPQAEIASALEKVEGDTSRVEYAAAAIVSDPLRRLVWHCLRRPPEPPSAWAFIRRYRWTKIEGNIAAYMLHEAVTRELQGLRGDALVELWEHVDNEFAAFLANPRLEKDLSRMTARWCIDLPTLPSEVKRVLQDVVPAMHAVLMAPSKEQDGQWLHWSNIAKPTGSRRLLETCALYMSMRDLEKARRAFESGNIIVGLQQYVRIAGALPQSDAREKRRILFEVGEHLTQQSARLSTFTTRDKLEQLVNLLRAIGTRTAFDSRLLSAIAFCHARAAERAVRDRDDRDINGAADHLLRAGLCDPDQTFKMEMLQGDVLHIIGAGADWMIGLPASAQLMTTLEQWTSALETGKATWPGMVDRELRQLAPWIDLVTRLDLSLPHDKAIAETNTFLVELSVREPGEPFFVTKNRIMSNQPGFLDIPWEAIEALDTQGNILFPELLIDVLPKPPPALDLLGKRRADVRHLHTSQKTLEDGARRKNSNLRAGRATFFWSWYFADFRNSAKEITHGLGLALMTPFALLGIAGLTALALLTIPLLKGDSSELITRDHLRYYSDPIRHALRVWFAYGPDDKRGERPIFGFAKFQGLVGVLLAVLAVVLFVGKIGREALLMHRRDREYTALCNAAATNDMAAVGKAARSFLNVTPPDKFDYRTLDVLEKHSEVLVREIARASRDKRTADLDQLVAEATVVQKRAQTEKQAWQEIEAVQ